MPALISLISSLKPITLTEKELANYSKIQAAIIERNEAINAKSFEREVRNRLRNEKDLGLPVEKLRDFYQFFLKVDAILNWIDNLVEVAPKEAFAEKNSELLENKKIKKIVLELFSDHNITELKQAQNTLDHFTTNFLLVDLLSQDNLAISLFNDIQILLEEAIEHPNQFGKETEEATRIIRAENHGEYKLKLSQLQILLKQKLNNLSQHSDLEYRERLLLLEVNLLEQGSPEFLLNQFTKSFSDQKKYFSKIDNDFLKIVEAILQYPANSFFMRILDEVMSLDDNLFKGNKEKNDLAKKIASEIDPLDVLDQTEFFAAIKNRNDYSSIVASFTKQDLNKIYQFCHKISRLNQCILSWIFAVRRTQGELIKSAGGDQLLPTVEISLPNDVKTLEILQEKFFLLDQFTPNSAKSGKIGHTLATVTGMPENKINVIKKGYSQETRKEIEKENEKLLPAFSRMHLPEFDELLQSYLNIHAVIESCELFERDLKSILESELDKIPAIKNYTFAIGSQSFNFSKVSDLHNYYQDHYLKKEAVNYDHNDHVLKKCLDENKKVEIYLEKYNALSEVTKQIDVNDPIQSKRNVELKFIEQEPIFRKHEDSITQRFIKNITNALRIIFHLEPLKKNLGDTFLEKVSSFFQPAQKRLMQENVGEEERQLKKRRH